MKKDEVITVLLSRKIHKKLIYYAYKNRKTVSDVVKKALHYYFDEKNL